MDRYYISRAYRKEDNWWGVEGAPPQLKVGNDITRENILSSPNGLRGLNPVQKQGFSL